MTDAWAAEARALPVAFAQVREDPRVDLAVLDLVGPTARTPVAGHGRDARATNGLRGIMIASGGCTAATFVASGRFAALRLVDANAAQLTLTRLKLYLLRHADPHGRGSVLGHTPSSSRRPDLTALLAGLRSAEDAFGPPDLVAALGPDHAGRYEVLFARLRQAMGDVASTWPAVLTSADPASAAAPETPLGRATDNAFDRVMALDNLVALFGRSATQNAVQPFARHFADRTRLALARPDAARNPFLWQLLVGRFPPGVAYDWLSLSPPSDWPTLTYTHAMMGDALATADGEYDVVHLSNVLDWLTPAEAGDVLRRAHAALRPGGVIVIRQLNSTLDLPSLGPAFDWLTDEADALHAADRSFFYRRLHVGRR